jgi:dynein heavy chain
LVQALAKAQEIRFCCIDKSSVTELKSFTNPPAVVTSVLACLLVMLEGEYKDHSWKRAKKLLSRSDLLEMLLRFNATTIPRRAQRAVQRILAAESLTAAQIRCKSSAAGGLCDWIVNTLAYYQLHCEGARRGLTHASSLGGGE